MLDMLLGGPGETHEKFPETIDAFRQLGPDCAGASLGMPSRIFVNVPADGGIIVRGAARSI